MFQLPFLPEIFFHTEDLSCFERMFANADKRANISEEDLEGYKYTFSRKGMLYNYSYYYLENLQ